MIEEGTRIKFACGHTEVWPAQQVEFLQIGDEAICRACPREIILENYEGKPLHELNHWEEVVGLEKVKIKTTTEILPWD